MKLLFSILPILILINISNLFAQDKNVPLKTQIRPALLVIDIQKAYLDMIPDKERETALKYINGLIELFRSYNYPIIRVYHFGEEYGIKPDTEEFEYPASVLLKADDPKIIKTYSDGFNKTELDRIVREHGSNTLFLCGLSAVRCVLATWFGAQNHDYNAFLVKDALMSHNPDYTNNAEDMFDAISYNVVKLILSNCEKPGEQ